VGVLHLGGALDHVSQVRCGRLVPHRIPQQLLHRRKPERRSLTMETGRRNGPRGRCVANALQRGLHTLGEFTQRARGWLCVRCVVPCTRPARCTRSCTPDRTPQTPSPSPAPPPPRNACQPTVSVHAEPHSRGSVGHPSHALGDHQLPRAQLDGISPSRRPLFSGSGGFLASQLPQSARDT
jgi:hypothetical protein